MNRLNWMTYLKILFDQLEKIQDEKIISDSSSFLSSNNKIHKKKRTYVEKVDRTSFTNALLKIKGLLPLMMEEEYSLKFPNEKAISVLQVENQMMCSRNAVISWDQIIDEIMSIGNQRIEEFDESTQSEGINFINSLTRNSDGPKTYKTK